MKICAVIRRRIIFRDVIRKCLIKAPAGKSRRQPLLELHIYIKRETTTEITVVTYKSSFIFAVGAHQRKALDDPRLLFLLLGALHTRIVIWVNAAASCTNATSNFCDMMMTVDGNGAATTQLRIARGDENCLIPT